MIGGYMGKILDIDLSSGKIGEYKIDDEIKRLYVGGKGIAARILYDTTEKNIDPLSPENVLIAMTGPMTGTGGPSTSRFDVTTKSPISETILSSNCGGNFGIYLKKAGYDGVVIRGKSENPVYLDIDEDKVEIKEAPELWGLDTEETQANFKDKCGTLVIGPAGENKVLYACIISGERALGRGGAGAVMGSKNLKAIVARGKKKVPVSDVEQFKKAAKRWSKILTSHPMTGESLPRFGTSIFVNICNERNILPTSNYQKGHFDYADEIGGEAIAEKYLVKNEGCVSCPIKCARVVEFEGKRIKGPEFETVGLLGSNLSNRDLGKIIEWNRICDLMGMDTISVGSTLGFVMELGEKRLIKTDLKFGKTDNVAEVLYDIAYRRGFGNEMADGVRRLSRKYGGEDFAIHAKGLEFPSYDPRGSVGHGLGYATSNRGGCHINGGYMVYLEAIGPITTDPFSTKSKPELVIMQQDLLESVSAMGTCLFTSFALFPPAIINTGPYSLARKITASILNNSGLSLKPILKHRSIFKPFVHLGSAVPYPQLLSAVTGFKYSLGDFLEAGERVFNTERMFNIREGINGSSDKLPERITKEPIVPDNPRSIVPLERMLPEYYEVRGWDKNGIPKEKTLKRLGIKVKT